MGGFFQKAVEKNEKISLVKMYGPWEKLSIKSLAATLRKFEILNKVKTEEL